MIKLFICTFNNHEMLKRSFSSANARGVEIVVINNGRPIITSSCQVINNAARPSFSTGHLARTWNQALMHGFVNLQWPSAELVVTIQDDAVLKNGWVDELKKLHEKFDFVQMGHGDEFCSYKVNAVRRIGMWDERFCTIQYQEADYLLRARLALGDRASINDDFGGHFRSWNNVENKLIELVPTGNDRGEIYNKDSCKHIDVVRSMWEHKWSIEPENWGNIPSDLKPKCNSYITYPYFEKDCDLQYLKSQGFVI